MTTGGVGRGGERDRWMVRGSPPCRSFEGPAWLEQGAHLVRVVVSCRREELDAAAWRGEFHGELGLLRADEPMTLHLPERDPFDVVLDAYREGTHVGSFRSSV